MRRRDFLHTIALAGATGAAGVRPVPVAAEPPPEMTSIRLVQTPSLCQAAQYVADELQRAEGFADVQYRTSPGGAHRQLARRV